MGKVYVVDENNKRLQNVKVWRFFSLEDSFETPNSTEHRLYGKDSLDTLAYTIWGGYARFDTRHVYKPRNKYLRIQAKGYADVVIKELMFAQTGGSKVPFLYVRMYP